MIVHESKRMSKTARNMAVALGTAGEILVATLLKEEGRHVDMSHDQYDRVKDMLVDGVQNVEVKTQVPFIKENAMTFRPDQLAKCTNADELYFVLVSAPKHNYHYSGWVMKVTEPKNLAIREYRTKDGRDMLLVDIDQPAVQLWKRIPKQHLTLMNNLTVSNY